MGFRFRKSVKLFPGVRVNFSKTGVGFSAGVPGARYTKRADGKNQTTYSLPGTGISHVTVESSDSSAPEEHSHKTAACPNCGKRYRIETTNFCSNCGMQLAE
jgi:hypothetical protein